MATKRKKVTKAGTDPVTVEMAKRLRHCRRELGWTQAKLADATGWRAEDADQGKAKGLSPSAIGNYEQATRRFSQEEAEILGAALGVPSAYLLVVIDRHEADVILTLRRRQA